MAMNDFNIGFVGKLDGTKSKNQLNQDITAIQKTLNELKLTAKIDTAQVKSLENQLNSLKIQLNNVSVNPQALNNLVSQINSALSGIQIPNINIGGQNPSQAGQQYGKLYADSVNRAIKNVQSPEIEVGFQVDPHASDRFESEVTSMITKLQKEKSTAISYKLNTRTEFDKDTGENTEHLVSGIFKYTTATGEAITKTIQFSEAQNTWIERSASYSKSLDEVSAKTDGFVDKQKTAVTNLTNELSKIESNFNSSKKPLTDVYDIAQVENKIFDVRSAIQTLSTVSKDGFTDAKNAVSTEITELNNLITTLQNAEYAATSLRTKDINTVKIDENNNLDAFVQKMEQSGHYTDDLKNKVSKLRTDLSNVFDANSLTTYLNKLSNLQSEFKAVDASAKTVEKSTKLQTNIDSEKRILQVYTAELKEAGVLTGDVKTKIQDMFHSLSKVDSQNGLTTWRAELKGVKAETDAVLKSVQSHGKKEKDAYEVAYNELKKLYDLKIEYAKLGSNKDTDFYYGKAIADQENVWRDARANTSTPENWDVSKRLELEREELVMQDKLAQVYDKVTDAKKQAELSDEIQRSIDNGHGVSEYQNRINSLISDFEKYGIATDKAKSETQELQNIFNGMKGLSGQELVTQADKFEKEFKAVKISIQSAKLEFDKFAQPVSNEKISSLINRIDTFLTKNTKITKSAREELERYKQELSMGNVPLNRYNEINSALKSTENSMRTLGKLGASLKDQFAQAATSFTQWISVSSAIMAIVYQLKKMPDEVKELDDAITDLTMATGANKTQVEGYIDSYAKLGDELKATVTDVTISGTEWLKQGQSIADTETLITDAMVLSKVGKLSSADATKYLTSAMKGYKVSVEDTLGVVDKLSAVDMASATDVGGLAEAMSEVAASADLAGVSMDKLLGYAATIGEVTQSGMSEVGTTLNAVFSRMGNIKLARLKDYQNSGEDLSNVETVLKGVGISLRDSQDSFREFDDVLDETASNWTNYSEVQQRAIASAFAGTHHLNEFIVLMENYDQALKYSEISMESNGQAMKKFSAYQDSMSGHLEENRNAFIRLSNTVLDSDFLKELVDGGTAFLNILNGITDKIGVLSTIGIGGAGVGVFKFIKNLD